MKKLLTAIFSLSLMLSMSSAVLAAGSAAQVDPWGGQQQAIEDNTGLGTTDPRAMAGSLINVMLGFLGIIAVVIILLGGFKWMTAAGNEDKVGESKKLLAAGVIGLIIILMSYGLAQLVLTQLMTATGANV